MFSILELAQLDHYSKQQDRLHQNRFTRFYVHARTNPASRHPGPAPQYLSPGPYGPSTDNYSGLPSHQKVTRSFPIEDDKAVNPHASGSITPTHYGCKIPPDPQSKTTDIDGWTDRQTDSTKHSISPASRSITIFERGPLFSSAMCPAFPFLSPVSHIFISSSNCLKCFFLGRSFFFTFGLATFLSLTVLP